MSKKYSFNAVPFPFEAWGQTVHAHAFHATGHLPKDWSRLVVLKSPPDPGLIEQECRAVLREKKKRAARLDDIIRQAEYIGLLLAVVAPALGATRFLKRPALQRMIQQALYDLEVGVFRLKTSFSRGRPYHCCDLPLDPVFAVGTDLHPAHPSYPSGHAAAAYTVALLVAELAPKHKKAMLHEAGKVARNREIAGLHFASDSAAGAKLAKQFVKLILARESFAARMDAARAEWTRPAKKA